MSSFFITTLVFFSSITILKATKVGYVIEGVVYCQDCSTAGTWSLNGAKPVVDATVGVSCQDYKRRDIFHHTAKTNAYGWFYEPLKGLDLEKHNVDTPAHACTVHLVSSGDVACDVATDTNFGVDGSPVRYERTLFNGTKYESHLYSSGMLAFRPGRCGGVGDEDVDAYESNDGR